jgi:hypothetical protein
MSIVGKLKREGNAFLGLLTLLCGLGLLWSSAMSNRSVTSVYAKLFQEATPIDVVKPDPSMNRKVVIAAGTLESMDALEDEFLKPQPLLAIKRHVEMLQWVESFPQETEGSKRAAPLYELAWREGQVDFFQFQKPEGHENPLMKYTSTEQSVKSASFGAFNGMQLIKAIKSFKPLPLNSQMLKDPRYTVRDNAIYIPRQSDDIEALGTTRVWYEALVPGDYTVVAVQADEHSLIGNIHGDSLYIRQGRYSPDELYAEEAGESKRFFGGLVTLSTLLLFAGLTAVLSPFAQSFDLRPTLAVQGKAAVAVVSLGIAVTVVGVFWILSLVSS